MTSSFKMDNLTLKEKLKLKVTGARMSRLPKANQEAIIANAQAKVSELIQKTKAKS